MKKKKVGGAFWTYEDYIFKMTLLVLNFNEGLKSVIISICIFLF